MCPNLTLTKISARDTLHSSVVPVNTNAFCTLMLLSNLKEPDWISIPCEENLLAFTVCRKEDATESKYSTRNIYKLSSMYLCKSHHILVNDKCYSFLWNKFHTISEEVCNSFQGREISMKEFTSFYHIFDAVSSVKIFPTFITLHKETVHIIHIQKTFQPNKIYNYSSKKKLQLLDMSHVILIRSCFLQELIYLNAVKEDTFSINMYVMAS